jgi:hypothetical protein
MSDRDWIGPIVERVVGQVLDSHKSLLHSEIVRRVMEEVDSHPAPSAAPAASTAAADLARAVAEIQIGTSQKEILRALLDASSRYAARVALFVVKGNHATGWQARGFEKCEVMKDFALDSSVPALVKVLSDRAAATVPAAEFDPHFNEVFGAPASGEGRLLPLILKDKIAALVYADAGINGTLLDTPSLEVIVLATSAWLEVNTLRKQTQKEPGASAHGGPAVESAPPMNDPFASHPPAFAMAAAASGSTTTAVAAELTPVDDGSQSAPVGVPQTAVVEQQSAAAPAVAPEPLPVGQVETDVASTATPTASPAAASGSPEDQETHRKAQRFARLLVDEIKLYNQASVSEGRKSKDLYDRLKDTIDKSRATYQKRYGNTVAASGNYFQHELIRSLAEDDPSAMGSNFHL